MTEARSYQCPNCGGVVREAARRCNFCGSHVASLRCPSCFMMNVCEANHCMGCGCLLGLMPVPADVASVASCPRCVDRRLDAFRTGDELVYDCASCGGQFVELVVLSAMIRRHQTQSVGLPFRRRPDNPLLDKVAYLRCPFCVNWMTRRNFGRTSGIVVDVCAVHGTWFDIGELARILAHVGQVSEAASTDVAPSPNATSADAASSARLKVSATATIGAFALSANDPGPASMQESTIAFLRWVREMLR